MFQVFARTSHNTYEYSHKQLYRPILVTGFDYLSAIIRQKIVLLKNYRESYIYAFTDKSHVNANGSENVGHIFITYIKTVNINM